MRIAIATFEGIPPAFQGEDRALVGALEARGADVVYAAWSDPTVAWTADLVVVRSVWDYTRRHAEFTAWVRSVDAPMENAPAVILWNSDKRYLGDLAAMGVPTVPTRFVAPDDTLGALDGAVVVKPTISAGGRDTGRFGPAAHGDARTLIRRIVDRGDTAMVQPYLAGVERHGETAVVTFAGVVSHALRKGPVLREEGVAPVREDDLLGAAEVMYDPDLVGPGTADADERRLVDDVLAALRQRFGAPPLVARVDMVRDGAGRPVLLELEAVEPNLYVGVVPQAVDRLADAILRRAGADAATG